MEEKEKKEKNGFSGISSFFSKLVNNDEYLAELEETENQKNSQVSDQKPNNQITNTKETTYPVVKSSTNQFSAPNISQVPPAAIEETLGLLYEYLESINIPGIDFMEFWNAIEAMGGPTAQNIKSAHVALNIGAGGNLTLGMLNSTAKVYKDKLSDMVRDNISAEENERDGLVRQKEDERTTLASEVENLINEIKQKEILLKQKQNSLTSIDIKYTGNISAIDQRISIGQTALKTIRAKMDQVIDSANKVLKTT